MNPQPHPHRERPAPDRPPADASGGHTSNGLGELAFGLAVPDELVEAVARRAAELAADMLAPEPWLDVAAAGEHLACPPSRVYALVSAGRIPVHRDGSRLLFRRAELDRWVEAGGARRP